MCGKVYRCFTLGFRKFASQTNSASTLRCKGYKSFFLLYSLISILEYNSFFQTNVWVFWESIIERKELLLWVSLKSQPNRAPFWSIRNFYGVTVLENVRMFLRYTFHYYEGTFLKNAGCINYGTCLIVLNLILF